VFSWSFATSTRPVVVKRPRMSTGANSVSESAFESLLARLERSGPELKRLGVQWTLFSL
jgi:hypothetical protein